MTLRKYFKLGLIWVFLLVASITSAGTPQKRFDRKKKEILGIELGTSSTEDIRRVLGPASESDLPLAQHELSQLCYASSGPDRTILQFIISSKPVEFRFFSGSPQDVAKCSKSAQVTAKLATGSRIRLGMSQKQAIDILGHPTKIEGKKLIYDFSYDRALTDEEKKKIDRNNPSYRSVDTVEITEKIELEVTQSKVSKVDITYSEM